MGRNFNPHGNQDIWNNGEKYDQILQDLPAAFYTTDANGFITSYNKAAVELWGRTPKIGTDLWCSFWNIYNIDGSPLPIEECPMVITLKEKRPVSGQKIIIERPGGERQYIAPHSRPILDSLENLLGGINILMDITEQMKLELALQENQNELRSVTSSLSDQEQPGLQKITRRTQELNSNEERYHKMIEEVEDYAIILLDKEGTILNWNRGAEKIKGYKEEEIVGKSFKVFYRQEDQESNMPFNLIEQAKTKGKAMHEGWRVRKDKTMFWGSIVITALHDDNANVIGFSKVTRDLTERKMADDKMTDYARDLEFQNRELQQFAFAAAHDLKEPLRKIQLYITSVLESLNRQLPEKEKTYLSRSAEAVLRLQRLIDDILTYSRTTARDEAFELVDLQTLVTEIRNSFLESMSDIKTLIEFERLPTISGIPFQLRQLFENLIGNSIKYRHPERIPHITISCEKIKSPLFPDNSENKGKAVYKLMVKDNGIGFEQKYSEKIFEMFNRLHTRYNYPGTGIGLALCRKIMQNHRGHLTASAIPNQGATFCIYIPV